MSDAKETFFTFKQGLRKMFPYFINFLKMMILQPNDDNNDIKYKKIKIVLYYFFEVLIFILKCILDHNVL